MLGLPGNPVSSMISFELFGRPAIRKMLGLPLTPRPQVLARMEGTYKKTDKRRHYLRVQVQGGDGGYTASLTGDQGSGILTSMSSANGLAVVPEEWPDVRPGQEVPVWLLG